MLKPIGFWTYSSTDDEYSRGRLSQLRALLASELQQKIGRTLKVNIFQDVAAIPPGADWQRQIRDALDASFFLIPIVTPALLQSEWCCQEITLFRQREETTLRRNDLIFPLHYMSIDHLNASRPEDCCDPQVFTFLRSRQWIDFRTLRLKNPESEDVAHKLEAMANAICSALRRPELNVSESQAHKRPEEEARQAIEEHKRAEEQRRLQAAEAKRRAEEEERRRVAEAKRQAEEEQRERDEVAKAEKERARKEAERIEQKRRHEQEEQERRQQAEEEAKRKAEEEELRKPAEAQRQAEEERPPRKEAEQLEIEQRGRKEGSSQPMSLLTDEPPHKLLRYRALKQTKWQIRRFVLMGSAFLLLLVIIGLWLTWPSFQRPPGELTVVGADAFIFTGTQGGPFNPASIALQLRASGSGFHWSAEEKPSWLKIAPSQGDLTDNGSVQLEATLDFRAELLLKGEYEGKIAFKNHLTDTTIIRVVQLIVSPKPPVLQPAPATQPLSEAQERALNPKDSFKECPTCPEMVVMPPGAFVMGSPDSEPLRDSDEGPRHPVTLKRRFAVGKFAVTFDEWDACADNGGCNGYRPSDEGWGRGSRPVIQVNWTDAKAYVTWISRKTGRAYRLLSEAEREYVTRAGTTTPFWFGSSISLDQANYGGVEFLQ